MSEFEKFRLIVVRAIEAYLYSVTTVHIRNVVTEDGKAKTTELQTPS